MALPLGLYARGPQQSVRGRFHGRCPAPRRAVSYFQIIDDLNRETLSTEIWTSLGAERVILVLDLLKESPESPHRIRVVKVPEVLV